MTSQLLLRRAPSGMASISVRGLIAVLLALIFISAAHAQTSECPIVVLYCSVLRTECPRLKKS